MAANENVSAIRWKAHPFVAALVRALVFLIPLAASVATAYFAARFVPKPTSIAGLILWWWVIAALSLIVLFGSERLARRLLPLAALLELSLLFPDRMPSRLAVARRAGRTQDLRVRVMRARERGVHEEPALAAEVVLALISSLAAHDRATRGHAERVRVLVDMIASEMRIQGRDRELLRWSALLHDIGKLVVPTEILNKPESPDDGEWEVLKQHPLEGLKLAAPLIPWLGKWAGTIEHHHERYDGKGYPGGLRGEQISLGGRIVSVADSYDSMTAVRPYSPALSVPAARAEMAKCAGSQFDPKVVRAFLNVSIGKLWRTVGVFSWLGSIPALTRPAYLLHHWGSQIASATVAGAAVVAIGITTVPLDALAPFTRPTTLAVTPTELPPLQPSHVEVLGEQIVREEAPVTSTPPALVDETTPPADSPVAPEEPSESPTPSVNGPAGRNHGECVSREAQASDQSDKEKGDHVSGVAQSDDCRDG